MFTCGAQGSIQNGSEEQEDKKAGKGTKRKGRKAAVGRVYNHTNAYLL